MIFLFIHPDSSIFLFVFYEFTRCVSLHTITVLTWAIMQGHFFKIIWFPPAHLYFAGITPWPCHFLTLTCFNEGLQLRFSNSFCCYYIRHGEKYYSTFVVLCKLWILYLENGVRRHASKRSSVLKPGQYGRVGPNGLILCCMTK